MAVSYIGASTVTTTIANQTHTPHASTAVGDLVVFFHYTNPNTGDEAVTSPTDFTDIFNAITNNFGLICVSWKIRASGDTTYSSTIANHATGTTGDSMLEWTETYRGVDATNPIVAFTASNSTWASSLNIGSIAAPASASLADGNMVVVFGGRIENVTGQTLLTGHSLTWQVGPIGSTNTGRDAGTASQHGLNATGSAQTITAKTITTTGTAQAGAGRMFFLQAGPSIVAAIPGTLTLRPQQGFYGDYFDTFERADSDTPGSPWIESSGDWDIISNRIGTPDSSLGHLIWGTSLGSADHWIEATIGATGAGQLGLAVRSHATAYTCVSLEVADGFYKVIEVTNGSTNTVLTGAAHSAAVGEVYRAESQGNVVRLYMNGTLVLEHTTTHAAGNTYVALNMNETTAIRWDDFQAGTFGGGPSVVAAAVGQLTLTPVAGTPVPGMVTVAAGVGQLTLTPVPATPSTAHPTRSFDGATDRLRWTIGNLSGMTYGTFALLAKCDDTATFRTLFAFLTSADGFIATPAQIENTDSHLWHNGSTGVTWASGWPMGTWVLAVLRKATGTATPRRSLYRFDTQAWAHANASGTIADWSAPGATGRIATSTSATAEEWDGLIGAMAAWANEVHWTADASGDSAIEAAGLEDALQNWADETPDLLWQFDQAAVTTPVNDLIGAADQDSRTGTTVVTTDPPPSFDWTLTSGSTIAATPGTLTLTAVAATPVPGPVTVASSPGTLTLNPVAGTPVPGMVTVAAIPGTLTLIPVPAVAGGAVAAIAGTLTLTAVAATPIPGPVTVASTPGALTLTPIAATPVPGMVTVAAVTGTLTLTAVAAIPVGGLVAVAGTLTLAPIAGTPVPGMVAVAAVPGLLVLEAVPGTFPLEGTIELTITVGTTRLRSSADVAATRSRAQVGDAAATRLGTDIAVTRSRAQIDDTGIAATRSRAAATVDGTTRSRAQAEATGTTRLGTDIQPTLVER